MAERAVNASDEAIVISLAPDVCLTPSGSAKVPVPYTIQCRFNVAQRTASSVRCGSLPAFTLVGRLPRVVGDEPGIHGGVISGVNQGHCRPAEHSGTVRAEGAFIVRHGDLMLMNCNGPDGTANTVGRVVYVGAIGGGPPPAQTDSRVFTDEKTGRIGVERTTRSQDPVSGAETVTTERSLVDPKAGTIDTQQMSVATNADGSGTFTASESHFDVRQGQFDLRTASEPIPAGGIGSGGVLGLDHVGELQPDGRVYLGDGVYGGLATPEQSGQVQGWWDRTWNELGEAAHHPWEATKGAGKGLVNTGIDIFNLLAKGSAAQAAGEMQQQAALQAAFGRPELSAKLMESAQEMMEHPAQITPFEMSNPAQAGGDKISTAIQLAWGAWGLAKGGWAVGAKLLARRAARKAGSAAQAIEGAANTAREAEAAANTARKGEGLAGLADDATGAPKKAPPPAEGGPPAGAGVDGGEIPRGMRPPIPGWKLGAFKSDAKWARQMAKRGWTPEQIGEAMGRGQAFPAENLVNPGNAATRYVHPETLRSVVVDNVTKEVIHVGGDGFKY
jgi:hypothetical protein